MMNEQDLIDSQENDWLAAEIEIGWQQADRGVFVPCTPETIVAKARALDSLPANIDIAQPSIISLSANQSKCQE